MIMHARSTVHPAQNASHRSVGRRTFATGCLTLSLVVVASMESTGQIAQQLGQVHRDFGDDVVPVFEGWEKNTDGSFAMVFGYMNRNYQEQPEIPIGPDNSFSPGPPDRGQPTHFYNRRQQFMFEVQVPADFGKKELVWTLVRDGRTEKAYATLLPEEELSEVVISQNRGGLASDSVKAPPNRPPMISIDGALTRKIALGAPLTLAAAASDDGIPVPPPGGRARGGNVALSDGVPILTNHDRPITQAVVKPSRQGLAVTWTHWRGPGSMMFDPMTTVVKGGKVATKVTFSEPGTYVIRAYADDGVLTTPADVTVIVTGNDEASR